jgi:hypothetical protein
VPDTLRIYIDDSGEKEYGANTSRYFVYAGAVVDRAVEVALSAEIDGLKRATFSTTEVEIKSNWLRVPRERQAHYLTPFGITDDALTLFVEDLYNLMASERLTYVAAAIDKPQMLKKYTRPYYVSSLAYNFLLQRYQKHCVRASATGYITIDDMRGSSPKKNQWHDLLRAQHARLKKDGCPFTKMRFDNLAARPLFAPSSRFNLLQVADLVAYNVFRQFRDHGDTWDLPGAASVPLYPQLDRLIRRFMLGDTGELAWGIVKWPQQPGSGRWRIVEQDAR